MSSSADDEEDITVPWIVLTRYSLPSETGGHLEILTSRSLDINDNNVVADNQDIIYN